MLATLIALLAIAAGYLLPNFHSALVGLDPLFPVVMAVAIPGFYMAAHAAALRSLVAAEHGATPRVFELYTLCKRRRLASIYILLYPLLTLICLSYPGLGHMAWVLATGVGIDALRHILGMGFTYLDPYHALDLVADRAEEAAAEEPAEFCHWQDALAATALKAITNESVGLAEQALRSTDHAFARYLDVRNNDDSPDAIDLVNFALSRLMRDLDSIFHRALDEALEPVANACVETVGKLCLRLSNFDVGMVGFPLHFLSQFAETAEEEDFEEVLMQVSCTMEAVAKQLISEAKGGDLKTPVIGLLTEIQLIAENQFRRNKSTSIQLLSQPFIEIKAMLKAGPIVEHPDYDMISKDLDRIIGEFAALAQVMAKMPPPGLEEVLGQDEQAEEEKKEEET